VNDATDWAEALRGRGYAVEMLLDGAATHANMVDALRGLAARAKFGDRIVYTGSTHGTYIPDAAGDEADSFDEAICPVDVDTAGPIVDDDIGAIFASRKHGVRAVIVSDSCHSGSVARFLSDPADGAPRFLPPDGLPPPSRIDPPGAARKVQAPMLLTGCADPEVAYDARVDGRPCGAFTRPAVDYLTAAADPTWYAVFAAARAVLPSNRWPQTPQVEATRTQRRWKVS
jgi:hypothetical protein